MTVSGFRNFNEARQYANILMQQEGIRQTAHQARAIVISKDNLELIGQRYSYNDYDTFYVHHFAPLAIVKPEQLYEPVTVKTESKSDVKADMPQRERLDENGNPIDTDPVKPMLPTEEVAPGGAMPVTNNGEENESDGIIAVPEETIAIPEETEIEVQEETIEVTTSEDAIEVAPSEDAIEVAPEEPVTETSGTEVVIQEDVASPVSNETEENFVITTDAETKPTDEEVIIIDDTPAKGNEGNEGESFILDDTPQQQSNDSGESYILEDDKKSMDAIEDEYYELDGF